MIPSTDLDLLLNDYAKNDCWFLMNFLFLQRKNTTGARRSWKLLIGGNQYHSLKNDDELLIGGEDEYDVPPKKPLDKTKRRTFGELLQKQYQDKSRFVNLYV